jgi:GNAT superfamily N-acetyltransferase
VADLEVRTAQSADIESLLPLVDEALSRLLQLRGGAVLLTELGLPESTAPDALTAALCAGTALGATTLVAVLEGRLVAFAVLVRTAVGFDLLGIHTERSLRRRRIGSELLVASRALAADQRGRFEALALPGDQTVKSLLEAAGFRARLLRMSDDR